MTVFSCASLNRTASSARLRLVMSRTWRSTAGWPENAIRELVISTGTARPSAVRLNPSIFANSPAASFEKLRATCSRSAGGTRSSTCRPSSCPCVIPCSRHAAEFASSTTPSWLSTKIASGECSNSSRNRSSLARSASAACLRPVMSRVIPSEAWTTPSASRKGAVWVSSQRRVPLSPCISNSSVPDSPRMTRSNSPAKAARCSGRIRPSTDWPTTWAGESASIIRSPAGFISSTVPSGPTSFTHSGSDSKIVRSRCSLAASLCSACMRWRRSSAMAKARCTADGSRPRRSLSR